MIIIFDSYFVWCSLFPCVLVTELLHILTVGRILEFYLSCKWPIFEPSSPKESKDIQPRGSLSRTSHVPEASRNSYFVLSCGELHFGLSEVFIHVVFMVRLVEPAFFELLDGIKFLFPCRNWWNCCFKTHFINSKIIIIPYQIFINILLKLQTFYSIPIINTSPNHLSTFNQQTISKRTNYHNCKTLTLLPNFCPLFMFYDSLPVCIFIIIIFFKSLNILFCYMLGACFSAILCLWIANWSRYLASRSTLVLMYSW